jgi:serpin B
MNEKSEELTALNRGSDVIHATSDAGEFAARLYRTLAASDSGNLVLSPSSIMFALAMTYAGARGETASEMADALCFRIPGDRLHEAFKALQATQFVNDVEFRIANRLWCQSGYHFLPDYLTLTADCYGSSIGQVDFRTNAESARQQVNEWVQQQTAGKIKELVAPASVNGMTRMILTNAVYFLGGWMSEFAKDSTAAAPFWSKPGEEHPVQMMHQTEHFLYGDFERVQVLELPYRYNHLRLSSESPKRTTELVMTLILPRQIDGLKDIEPDLSPTLLNEWTTLNSQKVNVSVPTFKIESSLDLCDALCSLGMRKAFNAAEADFSGISDDSEGLFVGEVAHKAFIDVNEKGTEAAAATDVIFVGRGAPPKEQPPKEFRADHPFLFLIRDRRTRLIHFMGRMTA